MRSLFRNPLRNHSLFVRLMLSFLAVIVLLVAFNFLSFFYLKNKIHKEIIKYNDLNMQHTMEGYERHIDLTKNLMLGIYQKEELMMNLNFLRKLPEGVGYDRMVSVQKELKALQLNPFLHYMNVMVHFKEGAYVLEKEGSSRSKDMFDKFLVSPQYPLSFWEDLFDSGDFFHTYPAAEFKEIYMHTAKSLGYLLPIIVKSNLYNDMYFIVLLDARSLFRTLHYTEDHPFFILNETGSPLFSTSAADETIPLHALTGKGGNFTSNGYYYFYIKGIETGFTYLTKVPITNISAQLLKLNIVLLTLLGATIVIGTIVSLWFSVRLHNPVKRLMESIQHYNQEPQADSGIREFVVIQEKLKQLIDSNTDLNDDLSKKNSLLRYYAYTNKFKRIHTQFHDLKDTAYENKPFSLMLVHVHFLPHSSEAAELDSERTTYFIREYINYHFSQLSSDSVIFQIDQDQILVIEFGETGLHAQPDVLQSLKEVLDQDKDLALFTIAVTPVFKQSSEFTDAYELALAMLKQRLPGDDTQIIVEKRAAYSLAVSAKQEDELATRISSGDSRAILEWTDKQLEQLKQNAAPHSAYAELGELVMKVSKHSLDARGLSKDRSSLEVGWREQLQACFTTEQFAALFERMAMDTVHLLKEKIEEKDPVTSFVQQYVNEHLEQDISLDLVADKLNISRSYLSTYFKEKTGESFSEYLNRVRISKAKEMLSEVDLKINDISARLGYQSVNSFIRMFKRYAGVTPGEYRKRQLS